MCEKRPMSRREQELWSELKFILQRYDDGALPLGVYEVIKKLQCDIALEQMKAIKEKED